MWQPHTYSRTKTLLADFSRAFDDADHVIILPIYAARERDTLGICSEDVVTAMRHPDAQGVGSLEQAVTWLCASVRAGDVVLTFSAGDGNRVGEDLLDLLAKNPPQPGTQGELGSLLGGVLRGKGASADGAGARRDQFIRGR